MTKTLAMLKMEKNFVALIEKKYLRKPYEKYTTWELLGRLEDEYAEALNAWHNEDVDALKLEMADMSNIIDYIFERLSEGRVR